MVPTAAQMARHSVTTSAAAGHRATINAMDLLTTVHLTMDPRVIRRQTIDN